MSTYEIQLHAPEDGGRKIELYGDFDLYNLRELQCVLRRAAGSRRGAEIDLSGVTFADLRALRELARHRRRCPWISFSRPSWQVRRGARACGLEGWLCSEPAARIAC